jgi:xanthine dehydrogenase accessory factor
MWTSLAIWSEDRRTDVPRPIFPTLVELQRQRRPSALATVVRTHGSTPQVVGAKMLVVADEEGGRVAGTLGGGCVEADAILAAREVIAGGSRSLRAYELTEDLAWNTGLVCGGTMWILAERSEDAFDAAGQPVLDAVARAADGGPPVAIVTLLIRDGRSMRHAGRAFVGADGALRGSLGDAELDARAREAGARQLEHGTPRLMSLDEGRDLLVDPVAGRPRLVIAGGGHVAQAIARQASLLDFDVTVLEDRPEFADPARFEGATVLPGDVPASLGRLEYGLSSFIVIATRGHKLDADCVLAAVRTPARYIGLLGSRRKTILIAEMLREQGIPENRIEAVRAPVGLDLGGRTPGEIALSVMAEITQERYAGSGRPLRRRPVSSI